MRVVWTAEQPARYVRHLLERRGYDPAERQLGKTGLRLLTDIAIAPHASFFVVAPEIVRTPIWNTLPEQEREAYFASRSSTVPAMLLV